MIVAIFSVPPVVLFEGCRQLFTGEGHLLASQEEHLLKDSRLNPRKFLKGDHHIVPFDRRLLAEEEDDGPEEGDVAGMESERRSLRSLRSPREEMYPWRSQMSLVFISRSHWSLRWLRSISRSLKRSSP